MAHRVLVTVSGAGSAAALELRDRLDESVRVWAVSLWGFAAADLAGRTSVAVCSDAARGGENVYGAASTRDDALGVVGVAYAQSGGRLPVCLSNPARLEGAAAQRMGLSLRAIDPERGVVDADVGEWTVTLAFDALEFRIA